VRKPRLTGFPTGHLTAYAYQEVSSLVLALVLLVELQQGHSTTGTIRRMTDPTLV
jgi:hypothetical protein